MIKDVFGEAMYNEVSNFSKANAADINALWYTIVGYQLLSNLFLNAIQPSVVALIKIIINKIIGACVECCSEV